MPRSKQVDSLYSMFEESNKVILGVETRYNPSRTASRIRNVDHVLQQLMEPFRECSRYGWGAHIDK